MYKSIDNNGGYKSESYSGVFKFTMIKIKLFAFLLFIASCFSSCETAKKAFMGIGRAEVKLRPANDVIKYYEPFFADNSHKTNLYVIANYDASNKALKSFKFPRTFLKDRENGNVYELSCFEDVASNIQDINNNIFSEYIILKTPEDFTNLIAFIGNKAESKLIMHSGENNTSKKWEVYIAYATFLGKKLRKMTLPVTTLNNINEVTILDLSIDENALKIE